MPATITVDTVLDQVAPNNVTSLREAIIAANQAQEPTVILFNKTLLNETITLGSQLPAIAAGKTAYILQGIQIGNNAFLGDGMYLAAGVTRNPNAGGVTYYGDDREFVE